jgi:2-polyprenyl-3-methyl-5-hydroxy-6-metoxy-1,4-benzoquinol methylase
MTEPIELQRKNWNRWNEYREGPLGEVSLDQQAWLDKWLQGRTGLMILDAGCGVGWACKNLLQYGTVVGTDLADEIVARAKARVPEATFISGDFMRLELGDQFDVVVCLEVLSHVADHAAFVRKLASHLKPNGELMMATQNAPILKRVRWIKPPPPGHLRRWFNRKELRDLLAPHFEIEELYTITPAGETGLLRILNSRRVSNLIGALAGKTTWRRIREKLGIGWTLMVRARRRPSK